MSEFVKVKLAGQTYHVHMDEKTNLARDEAKQRIQTLHRETSRRRKTLENKKISHEQKEEQHRQKVLNQRRAQLMLQTQRYLRSTSRRPVPPTSSRSKISRPITAVNYPSGTISARSDRGEYDSVLQKMPLRKKAKNQPASRNVQSARPMTAYDLPQRSAFDKFNAEEAQKQSALQSQRLQKSAQQFNKEMLDVIALGSRDSSQNSSRDVSPRPTEDELMRQARSNLSYARDSVTSLLNEYEPTENLQKASTEIRSIPMIAPKMHEEAPPPKYSVTINQPVVLQNLSTKIPKFQSGFQTITSDNSSNGNVHEDIDDGPAKYVQKHESVLPKRPEPKSPEKSSSSDSDEGVFNIPRIRSGGILRTRSETQVLKDSVDLAKNRAKSAQGARRKSVRWNECQFDDGTVKSLNQKYANPTPPKGQWGDPRRPKKILQKAKAIQSKQILEAQERGYKEKHLAKNQMKINRSKTQPSFQRPDYMENDSQMRRTPTDQEIVQLWQTVRNVLHGPAGDHVQNHKSFIPRAPLSAGRDPIYSQTKLNRPKIHNPSALSIEEHRLVSSLDRLNSRLNDIEISVKKKNLSDRFQFR